tara:strand:+ start:795 stop:1697 length:903 start_codon:yes stop_codon:yes gene_type:complete
MPEEEMNTTDHGHDGFAIKAYIITMMNNNESVVGTRNLLRSITATRSQIQPFIISATIPTTIELDIKSGFSKEYQKGIYKNGKLNWTWPINQAHDGIDFSTGLYKKTYSAADWRKVTACMISHMRLWQHCIDINEPIMILEHDAYFVNTFMYRHIALNSPGKKDGIRLDSGDEWTGGICGINSPQGATRKATIFDFKVKNQIGVDMRADLGKITTNGVVNRGLTIVPYVDEPGDLPLPSGLAGNSAYIIKPWAAKKLLDKVTEVGLWPNDALMCRQFFPWLQQYYPYYTILQNLPSTTTK